MSFKVEYAALCARNAVIRSIREEFLTEMKKYEMEERENDN